MEPKKIPSAKEFYLDVYDGESIDDNPDSSFTLADAYARFVADLLKEGWEL